MLCLGGGVPIVLFPTTTYLQAIGTGLWKKIISVFVCSHDRDPVLALGVPRSTGPCEYEILGVIRVHGQ